MIKMSCKLPKQIAVAVSGGIDSVVALDFLVRKHNVSIVHIDHSEGNSADSAEFVHSLAQHYNIPIYFKRITETRPYNVSREEFWRNQRYEVFHSMKQPVVTAHTLDDCVETWLWSSMHGKPKLIPITNANVIRPFLTSTKQDLSYWAIKNKLQWIEDESNKDLTLTRNYIRQNIVPHALVVNPGLYKTIFKKVTKCLNKTT